MPAVKMSTHYAVRDVDGDAVFSIEYDHEATGDPAIPININDTWATNLQAAELLILLIQLVDLPESLGDSIAMIKHH